MSELAEWLPEPLDGGRFRFGCWDPDRPLAHLSDEELLHIILDHLPAMVEARRRGDETADRELRSLIRVGLPAKTVSCYPDLLRVRKEVASLLTDQERAQLDL